MRLCTPSPQVLFSTIAPPLSTLRNHTFPDIEAGHSEHQSCTANGNDKVNILFSLDDGTVLASTDKKDMAEIMSTSGDIVTLPSVRLVIEKMRQNRNVTQYISLDDPSHAGDRYIVSAERFGKGEATQMRRKK